jgi:hypothetical protein
MVLYSLTTTMSLKHLLLLGAAAGIVNGHGGHAEQKDDITWDAKGYAEQHVSHFVCVPAYLANLHFQDAQRASHVIDTATLKHIRKDSFSLSDSFDLASFFLLHDLNRDGYWDRAEIEAVYGVHHEYSKAKTPDEKAQQAKADTIVDAVLKKMDKNGDGLIDRSEFEAAGWEGLESFKNLGAEGHHYDVESGWSLIYMTPATSANKFYPRVLLTSRRRIPFNSRNTDRVSPM